LGSFSAGWVGHADNIREGMSDCGLVETWSGKYD
jgi:hypothetical protein